MKLDKKFDENEFFREAALRICGTFEIEKALWNCFKYISKFIKVDKAYLHYFKPEENCGIIFARADHDRGQRVNIKSFPPSDVCSIMKSGEMPEQLLFNRAIKIFIFSNFSGRLLQSLFPTAKDIMNCWSLKICWQRTTSTLRMNLISKKMMKSLVMISA
jgi:hypothetical protein